MKLLDDIRSRTWTGHNIPLGPSEATIGMHIPLISEDARTRTIKSLIRGLPNPGRSLRVLDLGSLEGGLTLEMAREGWEATGIEGRLDNFQKAELIREYYAVPNLRFQHRDVKTLSRERDGTFDAILCCGLLYHLDDPFLFLGTLAEMTTPQGLLFLDTHVAPDEHAGRFATHAAQLSEPTTYVHEGEAYEGRWFSEPAPKTGTVLDEQWSATSNDRSFWPTRRALIRATYRAGYHSIAELFGMFEINVEFDLRDKFSRLYLACRKEWT